MTNEIISMLPAALLSWYPFKKHTKALYCIGGDPVFEVLFEVLNKKGVWVEKALWSELDGRKAQYDYIIAIDVLERVDCPVGFLRKVKGMLKENGRIFLGLDNRFAIRYFCGDKDRFSNHVLDSIDNYRKLSVAKKHRLGGRAYAKAEVEEFLEAAGLDRVQFYSVMPSICRPQMLLKDGYRPNEPLDIRIFPEYKSAETVYLEEEFLYDSLLKNEMFHRMANGYLVECSLDGSLYDADQITVQSDRAKEQAMATIIKKDQWVMKRPLYQEAEGKAEALLENNTYLKDHHIPVAEAFREQESYVMPYIEGQIATTYFRELLRESRKSFRQAIQEWKHLIETSSEAVPYEQVEWEKFDPDWEKRKTDDPNLHQWEQLSRGTEEERKEIGIILRRGYVDMVSLNCFHTSQGFVFFDQEFYIENFPANAILIRTIDLIYKDCPEMEQLYSREQLLKDLHLYRHARVWRKKASRFLAGLRNEKELLGYHQKYRREAGMVFSNRHRMDYPQEEYERLFCEIFKGAEHKKKYLFGAGNYAAAFLEQFGSYYEISGILDNNQDKWGQKLSGIPIMPPEVLKQEQASCKVYLCIKFFEDVLEQLKQMGVRDISVFDPGLDYERPGKILMQAAEQTKKPYHIGYVSGVFDLFHMGHLNLLKRAKEQCDYLIVGVVSDEQVIQNKKTKPYIPFEERRQIVAACKYVDEAVKIPMDKPDTEEAWHRYHFDVQFSGSDYAQDPVWLAKQVFLQQHGADMVFFPYTDSVSSTQLKAKVNNRKDQ